MIFVLFNLFFSYNILLDNYQSESSVLSESDVPMLYKQQVTEYIANDWSETEEGNKIPIFYDLGGGIYDWVNDFGNICHHIIHQTPIQLVEHGTY